MMKLFLSLNSRLLRNSSSEKFIRNLNQSCRQVSTGSSARLTKCFSSQDVEAFARLSLDDNALHLDSAHAQTCGYQDRVVHGILVNGQETEQTQFFQH